MFAIRLLTLCLLGMGWVTPGLAGPRLVSTSPKVTEWLFQLGKGGDLVATSDLSTYPPEAAKLPTIGPFFMPSFEAISKFKPHWVLVDLSAEPKGLVSNLESHGMKVLKLKLERISDLFSEAERLMREVYPKEKNPQLRALYDRVGKYPELSQKKFTHLIFTWDKPPILAGEESFLSDLLNRVGGDNLVPDSWRILYPQVSEEWLIAQAPEVVVVLSYDPESLKKAKNNIARWWPKKTPRILVLNSDHFARAGFTPFFHWDEIVEGLKTNSGSK